MTPITIALRSLCPNTSWSLLDSDDYSTLVWKSDGEPPTLEEVQAEQERLTVVEAANQYQKDRAKEYPPIGEQLDALFHAGVFPEDMAAKIQAIKDKYPKA